MKVEDRILFGALASHVELREDMVRRTSLAVARANRFRALVGVAAIAFAVLQVVESIAKVPGLNWCVSLSIPIMLAFLGAWLLAATNVWCCEQRCAESRGDLIDYVRELPGH